MKTFKGILVSLGAVSALAACAPGHQQSELADNAQTGAGIIGGSVMQANNPLSKNIVAVYDTVKKGLCTGSLLGNNLVLTAAHCIGDQPQQMVVAFGLDLEKKPVGRKVDAAVVFPGYAQRKDAEKDTGDIALIHFQGTLPEGYAAATLLSDARALRNGANVLLAGYGITNGVTKVGSGVLRSVVVKIADARFAQSEILMDQTQGRGACHGDSGGPAYAAIGSQSFLFGITSRGIRDPQDRCDQYAAYTNALYFKSWIDQTSAQMVKRIRPNPQESGFIFILPKVGVRNL